MPLDAVSIVAETARSTSRRGQRHQDSETKTLTLVGSGQQVPPAFLAGEAVSSDRTYLHLSSKADSVWQRPWTWLTGEHAAWRDTPDHSCGTAPDSHRISRAGPELGRGFSAVNIQFWLLVEE